MVFRDDDLRIRGRISFLRDRRGAVYGAAAGGKIYLNGARLNPEMPLHEYTHLWDEACRRKNPELWKRGMELMRRIPLWERVRNDPAYADIRDDVDAVASEVHSRLTGRDGARLLEEMAASSRAEGAFAAVALRERLKRWLSDFWWWLKDALSPWTAEEARRVSLGDFAAMPLGTCRGAGGCRRGTRRRRTCASTSRRTRRSVGNRRRSAASWNASGATGRT